MSRGEEEKESELAMGERIVEDYIEEISKDVGIIGEEAIAAPVELAFHIAGEFSVFFVVLSVGAVWVLVWMVTVAFAAWVLNMFGFLNYIFLAFIALFDIIAIAWQTLFDELSDVESKKELDDIELSEKVMTGVASYRYRLLLRPNTQRE